MSPSQPRVVHVRQGRIEPVGSWIYVWVDTADGTIAHVGGTGFDPELRAFLHLTSADPELGRVRAQVPQWAARGFDVLAFELPADIPRAEAKRVVIERLDGAEISGTESRRQVDAIVAAIEAHVTALRG